FSTHWNLRTAVNYRRMNSKAKFPPALFKFLGELKKHNDREWFAEHKSEYERVVVEPFCAFILQIRQPLMAISPFLVADERAHGGSLRRVYRDIRFSKNKAPFKTNAAAVFWHRTAKDRAPGIYLHLQPGESFAAAGLWQPERADLLMVRQAIAAESKAWRKALAATGPAWTRGGEQLSRPPKGFLPTHPEIEELKYKNFVVSARLTDRRICAADFADHFVELCRDLSPMLGFLNHALGIPWNKADAAK
ncbi:MAG: TIGR02453 family protein, partial [Pyrinomonadaceae bacterium]